MGGKPLVCGLPNEGATSEQSHGLLAAALLPPPRTLSCSGFLQTLWAARNPSCLEKQRDLAKQCCPHNFVANSGARLRAAASNDKSCRSSAQGLRSRTSDSRASDARLGLALCARASSGETRVLTAQTRKSAPPGPPRPLKRRQRAGDRFSMNDARRVWARGAKSADCDWPLVALGEVKLWRLIIGPVEVSVILVSLGRPNWDRSLRCLRAVAAAGSSALGEANERSRGFNEPLAPTLRGARASGRGRRLAAFASSHASGRTLGCAQTALT